MTFHKFPDASRRNIRLKWLVEHYSLAAYTSMGISQIKRIVLIHLLDEEIIPSSEVTDEITCDKSSMTGEELLQLKRLEMEERDKEREAQYRMKELELREKELTFHVKLKELEAKVDNPPQKLATGMMATGPPRITLTTITLTLTLNPKILACKAKN